MRDTGTHTRISIKFSGNGESYLLDWWCKESYSEVSYIRFPINSLDSFT